MCDMRRRRAAAAAKNLGENRINEEPSSALYRRLESSAVVDNVSEERTRVRPWMDKSSCTRGNSKPTCAPGGGQW